MSNTKRPLAKIELCQSRGELKALLPNRVPIHGCIAPLACAARPASGLCARSRLAHYLILASKSLVAAADTHRRWVATQWST